MLASMAVSAQIIVFHPVKVPAELNEKFLDIELNYSQKIAQDAVNKGQLELFFDCNLAQCLRTFRSIQPVL